MSYGSTPVIITHAAFMPRCLDVKRWPLMFLKNILAFILSHAGLTHTAITEGGVIRTLTVQTAPPLPPPPAHTATPAASRHGLALKVCLCIAR